MAVSWTPDLATGNDVIDAEHKALIKAIDKLLVACQSGKGKEEVAGLLDFLLEYTNTHFSHEESLQRKVKYPDSINHRNLHQLFIKKIKELKKEHAGDPSSPVFVININKEVMGWLANHIKIEDVKIVKHMQATS